MADSQDIVKSVLPNYTYKLPVADYEVSSGGTRTFAFDFDYLDRTTYSTKSGYLKVYSGPSWDTLSENTSWTQSGQYTIQATVSTGDKVRIVSDSKIYQLVTSFSDGSRLKGADLNTAIKQAVFGSYENYARLLDVKDRLDFLESALTSVSAPRISYTATSGQTNFALTGQTGLSAGNVVVLVAGTPKTSAQYSVSDISGVSTVVLTSGATTGQVVDLYVLTGATRVLGIPDHNSVTTSTIQDGAVTLAKTNFSGSGSNGQPLMKRSGEAVFSTLTPSDISGLQAFVNATVLSSLAAPTTNLNFNGKKITSVSDPTSAQDGATKNYVDTKVATAVSGSVDSGRVVSGILTVTSLTSTVTLGWQPDRITFAVKYLTGGVFGATPTLSQAYQQSWDYDTSYGTAAQTWQFGGAASGVQRLNVQQTTTGFTVIGKTFSGGTPTGSQVITWTAIKNSNVA